MISLLRKLLRSRCRKEALHAGGLLCACILASLIAVLLAYLGRSHAQAENLLEQGAVDQSGAAEADLEAELAQRTMQTRRLQAAGFSVAADRVAWVDATMRTLDSLHPIGYSIRADVPQFQAAAEAVQIRYQQMGLEPPILESNDLALTIQGLHEDELAAAFEAISAPGGGVVRAEHCQLERRSDNAGLDVQCTLRRYRLRDAMTEPPS